VSTTHRTRYSLRHFLLLVASAATVFPPVAAGQQSFAGVVVGKSWSSVAYGSRGSTNGDRGGLSAGPFVRYRQSSVLSLAAELLLTPKGYVRTQPTIQMTYVELPLLAMIELAPRSSFSPRGAATIQPYVGGGVTAAVMLTCRRFFYGVHGYHRDSCNETRASNLELGRIRRVDVVRDLRLGLRFAGRRQSMSIDGRYARGFVDIDPSGDGTSNNVTIALSVRYERVLGSR
jgi:hypothetical protein